LSTRPDEMGRTVFATDLHVTPEGHLMLAGLSDAGWRIQEFTSAGALVGQWFPDYSSFRNDNQKSTPWDSEVHPSMSDIAQDPDGNVILVDSRNRLVSRFTRRGAFLQSFGRRTGLDEDDLSGAIDLAVGADGMVYVSVNYPAYAIKKFSSQGDLVAVLRQDRTEVQCPGAIVASRSGLLYVADGCGDEIYALNSEGVSMFEWDLEETGEELRRRSNPTDLAVDSKGRIVVLVDERSIQRYAPDGTFLNQFDLNVPEDDENRAYFRQIAVGPGDVIHTARPLSDNVTAIRRFTADGDFLGDHIQPRTGPGMIERVADIAFDGRGSLYVVDEGGRRIVKFARTLDFLTRWGHAGPGDSDFLRPRAITIAADGSVYVLDGQRDQVLKFGY